jgi:hypothetical protein
MYGPTEKHQYIAIYQYCDNILQYILIARNEVQLYIAIYILFPGSDTTYMLLLRQDTFIGVTAKQEVLLFLNLM